MLDFNAFISNSRRVAAAGMFAIGAVACSGQARATPVQLFPLFPMPPGQLAAPPATEAAPSDDEAVVREVPARLKRQIVSYTGREAAGTFGWPPEGGMGGTPA